MEAPSELTILVAEDDLLSRQLLQSYLDEEGHRVLVAENGREAVETFSRESPDLVILDVKMPVMDGLEACRHIKGMMEQRWVPVMMISSNNEEQDQAAGLNTGADYYLTKPISFPILAAKVRSSQRIANLQRELERRNTELSSYYRHSRAENDLAQQMIDRIIQNYTTSDTRIHQSVRSLEQFSGDVISTVNSHSGNTYALMADATGHGLPAAITLMPAMEIFYQMSRRGYGVASIVRQINQRLRARLPPNHFLAATVVLINPQRHALIAWNGACPQAYVLCPEGAIRHRIPSAHPPLGVLDDQDFDDTAQLCTVNVDDRFFACTDGLVEARNADNEMFGSTRLEAVLTGCSTNHSLVESVTDAISRFRGTRLPDDDQSMLALAVDTPMEVPFSNEDGIDQPPESSGDDNSMAGWDFRLELRGSDISRTEIVPTVNQVLENLRLDRRLRQKAFVVLTELLNNAVDHGLLGMESSSKTEQGFDHYVQERQQRLAALNEGFIKILATRSQYHNRNALRLMVMDSGSGFDTTSFSSMDSADEVATHAYGRGIRVVASLADRLRFLDNGASVELEFTIDPD